VVIKIAADSSCNQRLQNEVRILDALHEAALPQWKHLPLVLDRFQAGGRFGIVQRKISGFSLGEVRRHRQHINGVEQRHVAWMMDRLFSCLGFVHSLGVVHGSLGAEQVIVQPESHNVIVCGWNGAVLNPAVTGEKIIVSADDLPAPEIIEDQPVGPWTDIYALGKLMIWVLGGNPADNTMPDSVDEKIQRFLLSLVHENYRLRPDNAWDLHDQQCRIKDSLWPRKFLHFDMT
jgi:serine/threonine protein kinase